MAARFRLRGTVSKPPKMAVLGPPSAKTVEIELEVAGEVYPVSARGVVADAAEQLARGDKVYVTGRLLVHRWRVAHAMRHQFALEARRIRKIPKQRHR